LSAALLDVNVLVAIFDATHPHHEAAHEWFGEHSLGGWASCARTENGCLRVLSRSQHLVHKLGLREFAQAMADFRRMGRHEFWAEDLSLLDEKRFDWNSIVGPGQISDVYLLGLAVARGGVLVTFDRTIPWRAVKGAGPEHLEVLSA
jgi:hypothetical protein